MLLGPEPRIGSRGVVERDAVGDDEGRVDLAFANALKKGAEITLSMRLSHLERQALGESSAERHFVEKAAVDAGDGDRAAGLAAMDGLPQDMQAVGGKVDSGLGAVEHGVKAAASVR